MTLTSIISFIVVLAVLIFVHELGHFLVALWCRVKVLTFAIGFGPTIFAFTRGETEYALKAIPLGGYVRMFGEEDDDQMSAEEKRRTFSGKAVWQRMAIVFAGPLFNLITAALIFIGVFMWGVNVPTAQIGEVVAESAAAEAGMMADDTIVAIDGKPVREWSQLAQAVQESNGNALQIEIDRGGLPVQLSVAPRQTEGENIFKEKVDVWRMGITANGETMRVRYNPIEAVVLGLERTYDVTYLTLLGIVKLIQNVIPSDTIGGPILIAKMAGEQAQIGFMNVLLFVALLSVNLGVLNLLPIPVLDGGHLVFLAAEAIFRKPVSERIRGVAQQAGLFALLALMAFAFYNDIMRFFVTG